MSVAARRKLVRQAAVWQTVGYGSTTIAAMATTSLRPGIRHPTRLAQEP